VFVKLKKFFGYICLVFVVLSWKSFLLVVCDSVFGVFQWL
jgi:hypothetical protein